MEKILIVDDSATQAQQLREILEDQYDVTVARTGEDALRLAGSGDYSLVLLDVVMPGMDGFTLLKMLQEEAATRSLPVILITSLSAVENEERGLVLGAVDYITKPFIPPVVKARVNTHIRLYQFRRQAERRSMTDRLTGIANRRKYERSSVAMWQEAVRLHVPISVCMLDIDHFKSYNDAFGHPAGDRVLAGIAKAAASGLHRHTDFVARYGGEEFVGLFLGNSGEEAFRHLRQVRRTVEALHVPQDPAVARWVTVSIGGVTVIPSPDSSCAAYLKIADGMLYEAKERGRNRVVWTDERGRRMTEDPEAEK